MTEAKSARPEDPTPRRFRLDLVLTILIAGPPIGAAIFSIPFAVLTIPTLLGFAGATNPASALPATGVWILIALFVNPYLLGAAPAAVTGLSLALSPHEKRTPKRAAILGAVTCCPIPFLLFGGVPITYIFGHLITYAFYYLAFPVSGALGGWVCMRWHNAQMQKEARGESESALP